MERPQGPDDWCQSGVGFQRSGIDELAAVADLGKHPGASFMSHGMGWATTLTTGDRLTRHHHPLTGYASNGRS